MFLSTSYSFSTAAMKNLQAQLKKVPLADLALDQSLHSYGSKTSVEGHYSIC